MGGLPAGLPLPASVRLDLAGEHGAVPAAVPGQVACLPRHVEAAGEPWPPAALTTASFPGAGFFRTPSGRARRRGRGDSVRHLPIRDFVRVSAAHLLSLPAMSPAEGCCGPAADAARAMPLPAA
jgi:hypothetical protein